MYVVCDHLLFFQTFLDVSCSSCSIIELGYTLELFTMEIANQLVNNINSIDFFSPFTNSYLLATY